MSTYLRIGKITLVPTKFSIRNKRPILQKAIMYHNIEKGDLRALI
jgi:hypothetical protein